MGKSLNLSEEKAADMAIEATKRVGDIASFYNKSFDEVDTMIKSIWTGETESLKRIGVVMTQTNLQAFALSKGIQGNIEDFDQATMVQLRYAYVMEQTALAQGDFAKTSGSWANQTRLLAQNIEQIKVSIGTSLIQVLTPLLQKLNLILEYIYAITEKLREMTAVKYGKQSLSTAVETTSALTDEQNELSAAIDKTTKAQKRSLASFDKLNRLDSNTNNNNTSSLDINTSSDNNITSGADFVIPSISEDDITVFKAKIERFVSTAAILIGLAMVIIGIVTFNIPLILKGCLLLAIGVFVASDMGNTRPSWIDKVLSWGMMILGVALLIVGVFTANVAVLLLGIALLYMGYSKAHSSEVLSQTPAWVNQIISFGLMIVGVALLLIGIFTANIVAMVAGVAMLIIGFEYGDDSGAFTALSNTVNNIITAGLAILGVALLIIGICLVNPVMILGGIAALGGALAYGSSSGTLDRALNTIKVKFSEFAKWFSNLFSTVWEGIKKGFWAVVNFIATLFKNYINFYISGIEGFINIIISGVNAIIRLLNKIQIKVPEKIAKVTGIENFGINIPEKAKITLPRLSEGTVVPRSFGEFGAILGDNTREPEIVSPLSTMKQALYEVLSECGLKVTVENHMYLDGDDVTNNFIQRHNQIVKTTGKTPLKGV